jgi:hypothetical protein
MSEFDITPNFTSDIPDVGGMVPGEFEAPEAAIQRMAGTPEPTTPRLRTPMNPEGRAPRDGMGFRENVSGAFRSGTLAGVIAESAAQEDMASGGAQSGRSGFSPAQLAQMPSSVRARLSAPDPVAAAQSAQDAEDAVYAQIAFDNSKANLSGASVAGALVGSLASPESLGGISGLLVKQFKGLASRPILTAGVDAAAVNTLTDPIVQGGRMASGAQENFEPAQTAMAPVVGFALGAGVRGALELPSMARERAARQAAGQPEPLVEPTAQPAQGAPAAAAAEPAPVREAPPAATPEAPRADAEPAPARDPIAAAVDEALPELRETPAPVAREADAADAPRNPLDDYRDAPEDPKLTAVMKQAEGVSDPMDLAARFRDNPDRVYEDLDRLAVEAKRTEREILKKYGARRIDDLDETKLSRQEADFLFYNKAPASLEEINALRDVVSPVASLDEALLEISRAIRRLPEDMANLKDSDRLTVARLQVLFDEVSRLGGDLNTTLKSALTTFGERFRDPEDALFMVRDTADRLRAMFGGDAAPAARADAPALPAPARAGNGEGGQGRGGVARDGDVSPATAEMRRDPASWVIKDKETGAVIMETFDRAKVDALNTAKYEAVPIIDHLAGLNKKPSAELKFTRDADGRISGVDLEKSGLELTTTPQGEVLFRKRGSKTPAQPLPPNQVMAGRPLADQAAPRPTEPVRLVRIEEISRGLVEAFTVLGREGRVMPGAQGQYNTRSGVIRVKSVADLDTVAHEVGHSFHLYDAKPDVDGLIKANRKELEPLGSGDKTGDQEAFAELFRLFTINRPFAERSYPNATAALDELLRSKFPDQYRALDELRAAMDDLHRAPSGEIVSADTIQTEPAKFGDGLRKALAADYDPSGRTLYTAQDVLYTSVIDKVHPVWRAVENLKGIAADNGKPIDLKPIDDAYILSRMLPGSHGSAGVMLEHGVIPAGAISPEGPSLGSALEKALGKKWDEKGFADFGAYLTARRMVAEYGRFFNGEIPNPPGKFSLADYQKAVAEFDTANPAFREAADDVYGFLNNHLKRAYDKGLFSKEYYDASIARTDYVPFVRDMADFNDPASIGEGGAPKGLRFSLMKAFKGSQRSVQNPLESIFKRVHDLEFAIAQNDAIGALARLADAAGPGSGAIAERIPSNQLRGQRIDVVEALKAAGKSANIDDADLKALILQAEDQLGDSTWATLFKQEPIAPGREPIVFHWVNGERQALRLADGRFGTELFHALNAMSDVEKNWFASILQISQQILRSGVTKAPDFIITNFIRDQFTSAATSGRRYIPFISAVRGAIEAVTKTPDAVTYAGMGGMAGGAIADVIDRAAFGRNVRGLEKAGVIRNVMAGDILGAGGALLRTTAKALDLSEAATRMGLYKSYFEQAKGMEFDDLNAATYAAFKATDYIDFRKAGASMGWLRRWVPFLNAALQGNDREIRAVSDLPVLELKRARGETLTAMELDRLKDARVGMLRVLTLGAMAGAGLAVINADEPEYQNAPQFTKDSNWLVKVGDVWLAIPKPFGTVRTAVNAFETAADYAVRKDPSLWGGWLEGSAKGFIPPTNNPLVGLIYDLPANYNRFRESPIVPYYLQGVKPSEQYTINTSELSKMIGQATGWSPMKIEYAVSNMGGSSALNLLKASDLLMGADRPESQVYNWPVARRFVKNLVRGNQATTEFYKLVGDKAGKYEQSENAYRNKIRNGERANAAEFLRALPEDERAWTVLQSQGFEATEKRLHPMQNAKDRISVIGGMTSQLNFNNLIKEADVDRQNTTISRRDAVPISLDKSTRAKLIENFQELQFISARNAMITVGAKGTAGLKIIDDKAPLERIKAISPEAHAEYMARVNGKKIYEPTVAFQAWPEVKARLLRDGENADLTDLVPAGAKRRRKR